jgi:GntR family transcriptional regulator
MKLKIDKKTRIPIYAQIVEGIKEQIEQGVLLIEDKLPTERQFAVSLSISRNTVSQAYRTLEQEGFIQSRIGHGTFVTGNSMHPEQPRTQMLQRHVRHTVEDALALGFDLTELESAIHSYIENRNKLIASVSMVFIECNFEQANYFSHHLDLDPGVKIIPLLLGDLQKKTKQAISDIKNADIIVTSFYHLSEIQKLVRFSRKEVVAVSLEPDVSTLIRIARLASSCRLGIVTTSNQFLHEIENTLKKNNLNSGSFLGATHSSPENFEKILLECGAIIVSPGRKQELQDKVREGIEVIEFMFSPDRTSINNLKVSIVDLEKANNTRLQSKSD